VADWSFLTNHARVLLCIAHDPGVRLRDIAARTGVSERTAYGIVRQSGGYIRVESEPTHGTVFTTYWPQADEGVEADLCENPAANLSGSETILVVEDEPAVRKLMCSTLRKAGYSILEAPGSPEALSLCESYRDPIHLVISDVIMPGMSGPELARRLASIHAETKILFVSGYTRALKLSAGEQPGPLLAKPFSPHELASKVREVLTASFPAS